jgi:intergrase/recombinase
LRLTSENKPMQANVWMYLFFSLLVIAVVVVAYQDMRTADQPLIYYKEKYEDLERAYIELAKSHSYVLETIMKNNIDMQPYWPEFANKPKEDYLEYLRRRIVAMQVEIERLDRDHKP